SPMRTIHSPCGNSTARSEATRSTACPSLTALRVTMSTATAGGGPALGSSLVTRHFSRRLVLRHDIKDELQRDGLALVLDAEDALPLDVAGDEVLVETDGEAERTLHVLPLGVLRLARHLEVDLAGGCRQRLRRLRAMAEAEAGRRIAEDVVDAIGAAE